MTLVISERECEQVLNWEGCIECLEHAFLEAAEGRAMSDPRTDRHLAVSKSDIAARLGIAPENLRAALSAAREGTTSRYAGYVELDAIDWPLTYLFKTMVGTVKDSGVIALRVNSEVVAFDEQGVGRREAKIPVGPNFKYTGLLFLFSIVTGELLAIIQDGYLQRSRVTATAAVGTKYLARPDASIMGIIGSGAMAEAHVYCTRAVRPNLKEIRVYSPTATHRERFAAEITSMTGLQVYAVDSPEEAFLDVDIAIEATNAHAPIVKAEWLSPGVHYVWTSPGSTHAGCYERADQVVTTWRGYSSDGTPEIRDYSLPADAKRIPPFVSGGVLWEKMVGPELGEVVGGLARGRSAYSDITIHANMSSALQFAAVGKMVLDGCRREGLGRKLETDWFLQERHP